MVTASNRSHLYQRVRDVVVDGLRGRVRPVDAVEGEVLGRRALVGKVQDGALHRLGFHEHAALGKERYFIIDI